MEPHRCKLLSVWRAGGCRPEHQAYPLLSTEVYVHPYAAVALMGFLFMRRRRRRIGLAHKASTSISLDSTVSVPSLDGEIDPAEFVICRNAQGEEMCLGEGNFGKARSCLTCNAIRCPWWRERVGAFQKSAPCSNACIS